MDINKNFQPGKEEPQKTSPPCKVTHASVSMTKTCSPPYIQPGAHFVVEYNLIYDDSHEKLPAFTKVALNDPLFTLTKNVSIKGTTNICGQIDTKTGNATVDLSDTGGKLCPGQSIRVTVKFESSCEPPDSYDLFDTLATGAFFYPPDHMVCAAAKCGPICMNGDLLITKELKGKGPLYSGAIAEYKIIIKNVGNVYSVILPGGFNDALPLDKMCDIQLINAPCGIVFDGTRIYNTDEITLSPKEVLYVEFRARIL